MPRHCQCGGDCYLVGGPALYNMVEGKKNSCQLEATISIVNNSQGARIDRRHEPHLPRLGRKNGRAERRSTTNLDENLYRSILGDGHGGAATELSSRRVNHSRRVIIKKNIVGEQDRKGAAGLPPAAC